MRWPPQDEVAMRSNRSFYKGAAICRRGHVETVYVDPREQRALAENCPKCGARVLTACPSCDLRIRGKRHVPRVVSGTAPPRPSFCDGCGAAFPWASRSERIQELENLLDEEDIDDADRAVIQDALHRLADSIALSDKDEKQAWSTIKQRAGAALISPPVLRVVEGLVSAGLRQQLGLGG